MTYNVFGGMLNLALSIYLSRWFPVVIDCSKCVQLTPFPKFWI